MEKNKETKWYFLKEKEEWFGTAVNNERIFTAYYITNPNPNPNPNPNYSANIHINTKSS